MLRVRSGFLYEKLLLMSASELDTEGRDWFGSRFLLVVVELRRTVGRVTEAEDSCTEALLYCYFSSLSLQ